jgi:type I restriction enzyme M protein
VLGSQGDAGQFRTPRHIIDFMVQILDPKKEEIILDPACGTAGFLISSYKHILRANTDAHGNSTLTPDEKGRLARNFKGYDISPDMVRLSLVNLYLHGFVDPHIEEYDTLTSEEKWNEFADVILANPPFMSPKGGIKPHRRFSVQSKRSEVLFVDYMAEHLTPNGRAGIIVPEGIIFQSGTSYKQLRKMLVDKSLVAVISLPAGVFQPYSGVKTSILILDKSLARRSNSIAFFKVENDGFGLGAQRRAIEKNDLSAAFEFLKAWFSSIGSDREVLSSPNALIVPKEKIAGNGDYNLSGERYRENVARLHHFPLVRLADVCTVNPRKSQLNNLSPDTRVSFVPMVHLNEHSIAFAPIDAKVLSEVTASYTYFEDNDVLLAKVTPCFENGKAGIARNLLNGIGFGSSELYVIRSSDKVLPEWIYFCVMHPIFRNAAIAQMTGTGGLQRVPRDYVDNFQIPLPPLEVQKEIVAEIESYQKVIDGARAVLDNYHPHIPIDPDWPMVELGEIVDELESGVSVNSMNRAITDGEVGILKTSCLTNGVFDPCEHKSVLPEERIRVRCPVRGNTIIISRMNTEALVGANAFIPANYPNLYLPDRLWQTVISRKDIEVRYLQALLAAKDIRQRISAICGGTSGSMKNISKPQLLALKVPLPSLEKQQAIVTEIEAEQTLVAANRELIERFEKKIQTAIGRVWGEES